MLAKLKKYKTEKSDQGFTIIEVMIVLAIAGLILLIVFLAVPALQRSARNTQRKNDAAAVDAAISNYISDNNGAVPDTLTYAGGVVTVSCTAGGYNGAACTVGTNSETAKVGIFTAATEDTAAAAGDKVTNDQTVELVPGWNCNSTNTGLGAKSPRSASVLFQLEAGNGATNIDECQEQ